MIKVLKIEGFTGYSGFIRSYPAGEFRMFWKIL